MAPFPEAATLGWVIGLGIAAALVGCVVIGLIVWFWPGKEQIAAGKRSGHAAEACYCQSGAATISVSPPRDRIARR